MSNTQIQVLETQVAQLKAALKAFVSDARGMQRTLTDRELGEMVDYVTPEAFFGGFGTSYNAETDCLVESGDDVYVEWPNMAITLEAAEKLLAELES